MATSTYSYTFLPDAAHEDALHASRLLSVEERPYQRLLRRLQDPLLKLLPSQQATPPPEAEEGDLNAPTDDNDALKRKRFRENVLLDFAALGSSITRIQLIQSSNLRERERYAAEKAKILATAQSVRENTLLLREQLAEAQSVLEQRKGYDELAATILDDKTLKSRDVAGTEIRGLEKEIEELRAESDEYEDTWLGRREQFDRMVGEGEAMMRLMKGVKDEPKAPGDDELMDEGSTKADGSRMGTPAPEEGRSPHPEDGAATPMPESGDAGGATPAPPANRFLEIEDGTRSNSRAASPARQSRGAGLDVEMGESAGLEVPAPTEEQPTFSTGIDATAEQVAEAATESMDET